MGGVKKKVDLSAMSERDLRRVAAEAGVARLTAVRVIQQGEKCRAATRTVLVLALQKLGFADEAAAVAAVQ